MEHKNVSNKHIFHDYEILETYEAGIELLGTEVKSVRNGLGKLDGAHVVVRGGEAFLVGSSIPPFQRKNTAVSYDPERTRKLLLTKKELGILAQKGEQSGLTIVPIKLYNKGSKLKLSLALARGKKKHDKRHTIREKDVKRDVEREHKFKYQ